MSAIHSLFARIMAFFMSIVMYLAPSLNYPAVDVDVSDDATNYQYVFVHGLGGWGEYAFYYDLVPYWGTFGDATILTLLGLLKDGSAAEREATPGGELSELFSGGEEF